MTNHHKLHHKNHHHHHLPPPPPTTATRSTTTIQACAACRYQRRKCAPDCLLAPYFPHDRQRQFQNAHKLFGVSNITKIIRNLDRPQKDEAMRTIIYQSDVRSIDPVGGCYRIIRELQRQIEISCAELEFVLQQLALCRTLAVQNNNHDTNHHQEFNHDLIVIDAIDYDEQQLYDDRSDDQIRRDADRVENVKDSGDQCVLGKLDDSGWGDDQVVAAVAPVAAVESWSAVEGSPPPPPLPPSSQPLHMHASVCDEFKSLLITEVSHGERDEFKFKDANEQSEKSMFDEEQQKALIKVENVCYNEEQFGILTDHKAIHVEGEYGC